MSFQLFYFQQPLFLDDWFLNINRILDWNFNRNLDSYRYFNYFLPLDWRLLNVNRPININWFLDNSWHLNCNSFYNLPWNLFDHLNRHFFLDFNVFRNLNNLLNYSFGTRNLLYYFYYNLNRLLNNNLLYNFFWSSLHQPLYFIFPIFQQFFSHIEIYRQSIILSFLFCNNSIMIIAYFRSVLEILKLKAKPYSLFFRFLQLILKFFYFFEQFFQAIFIFIILLDLNLYLLVTLGLWCIQ